MVPLFHEATILLIRFFSLQPHLRVRTLPLKLVVYRSISVVTSTIPKRMSTSCILRRVFALAVLVGDEGATPFEMLRDLHARPLRPLRAVGNKKCMNLVRAVGFR